MSKSVATTSIPRFLLPQLTWRAPHLRPAATLPASPSTRRQRRRSTSHLSRPHYAQTRSQQRPHTTEIFAWNTVANFAPPSSAPEAALSGSIFRALQGSIRTQSASQASPARASFPHSIASSPSFSRSFHASRQLQRDHHFDTLKFVQRLKDEGFTEEQATAMMRVLSDVIEESIQNLTRTMVLREDAERATYTQKVDFTKLRSELLSSDNAEASMTRASHERLSNDLAKINSRLRDEIGRTQASVRLDLNLEKGRIREEANVQELKIKETEARIEQEVAGLRERVEGVKFSTLQWLMGVCTGTAAIILGAWRLLM